MLADLETNQILESTVESFWHTVREDKRPSWIKTLTDIFNEKKWTKDQAEEAMNLFCRKSAANRDDKEAKWMPHLGDVTRFLDKHVIGTSMETDVMAAWNHIPDCELCHNGFVHYVDWSPWEKHKVYRNEKAFCSCKKGKESPYHGGNIHLTVDDIIEKITSGEKFTLLSREMLLPGTAPKFPPEAEYSTLTKWLEKNLPDVKKWVEDEYAKVDKIPF